MAAIRKYKALQMVAAYWFWVGFLMILTGVLLVGGGLAVAVLADIPVETAVLVALAGILTGFGFFYVGIATLALRDLANLLMDCEAHMRRSVDLQSWQQSELQR